MNSFVVSYASLRPDCTISLAGMLMIWTNRWYGYAPALERESGHLEIPPNRAAFIRPPYEKAKNRLPHSHAHFQGVSLPWVCSVVRPRTRSLHTDMYSHC